MSRPLIILLLVTCLLAMSGCGAMFKSICAVLSPSEPTPAETDPQATVMANTAWLIPACLIGVGVGVFVIIGLKQPTWGLAAIAASISTGAASIVIYEHFKLIAWVGLAIVLVIVGLVAWINRKAFSQLVLLNEESKDKLSQPARVAVYGNNIDNEGGLADDIESKTTRKLVAAERKRIKKPIKGG